MAKPSAVIIGAGLAGLSAGCYGQMQGYQTTILEHATNPGGLAAYWKRKGYNVDGGIHFMSCHKPGTTTNNLYKELGVARPELFTDMKTYGRYVNETHGINITIGQDLSKFAADAKTHASGDHVLIDEIVNAARGFQGLDIYAAGMADPPELQSRLSNLRDFWAMRPVWKYLRKRYAQPVGHFTRQIKTGWLKDCVNGLFQPEVPMWFVFMLLAGIADGQMAYLTNGCEEFVGALEAQYKRLGGQVRYKSTVSRIFVKDSQAYGVRLANGEEVKADNVISAGDGYNTIFNLLNNEYTTPAIVQRYQQWPSCRPFLIASFGIKREFPSEVPFTTIALKDPLQLSNSNSNPMSSAGSPVSTIFLRIMNYGKKFAPPGRTLVQAEFETDWSYWHELRQKDIRVYKQEKQNVAKQLLNCIERQYPGISNAVDMIDIATPATTFRYTLNRYGSWGGWLFTPALFNAKIERMLPGLRNFYMAGQWVASGGVIPSLYSGKHAVKLMAHHSHK